jgi:hypothetical protein
MTHQRFGAAVRSVLAIAASALQGLRVYLVGGEVDSPSPNRRRRVVAWVCGAAGTLYLADGASWYLNAKSGLPSWLCTVGGALLAVPLLLTVTRPLLAWRIACVAAFVTGAAVQAYHRTPFSWHPAVFVALVVLLFRVVLRHPPAVTVWAWASMALLIAVSFYPADRFGLIVAVTVLLAFAEVIRRRRARSRPEPANAAR